MKKEIKIIDLPDHIRIRLSHEITRKIFFKIRKKYSTYTNFARTLDIPAATIKDWRLGRHNPPMWFIKKILKNFPSLSARELERNVDGLLKNQGGKLVFLSFPIRINKSLNRIVIHLMCDGFVGGCYVEYYNQRKELIDFLMEDMKKCFGDKLPIKVYKKDVVWALRVPAIIGDILKQIYKISFRSDKLRLSKIFFELDENDLIEIISTMIDDEGDVAESHLYVGFKSKRIIYDVYNIISKFNLKVRKSYNSSSHQYELYISYDKSFFNKLNLRHAEKREKLNNMQKYKLPVGCGRKCSVTKEMILNILKNKKHTVNELLPIIKIRKNNIRYHLRELEKDRKVLKVGRQKKQWIWCVK